MKIIIVPDEGDWVLVPRKVLESAKESISSFVSDHGWSQEDMDNMDMLISILVNPPCKVVELPEKAYAICEWDDGWNAYRNEIERRLTHENF